MRGAFSLGDDEAVAAATTYLATSAALEPGQAGGAIVVYGASLDALCAVQARARATMVRGRVGLGCGASLDALCAAQAPFPTPWRHTLPIPRRHTLPDPYPLTQALLSRGVAASRIIAVQPPASPDSPDALGDPRVLSKVMA